MSRLVLGLLPKLTGVIPVLRVASPLLYHAWSWHCSFYCIFWWKISRTYMAEGSVSAWGWWKWKHTFWCFGQWRAISDSLDSEELFLMLWTVESYFWCFGQWRAISDIVDGEVPFLILWTVEIIPPTILQTSVQISTETLELIIISILLIKIRCHYFLYGEHRACLRP